jgi:hypothetical protein
MQATIIALLQDAPSAAKTTDILLALFTFFLVVVGVLQYLLVRNQDKHFENSERAWLLARLDATEAKGGQIINSDSRQDGITTSQVEVCLTLRCENQGKSPAWIDDIWGHLEIKTEHDGKDIPPPKGTELVVYGKMPPIGAGNVAERKLRLNANRTGMVGGYSIFVLIEYHDIFHIKRQTTLGYIMDVDGRLMRPDAFSKRNRNT